MRTFSASLPEREMEARNRCRRFSLLLERPRGLDCLSFSKVPRNWHKNNCCERRREHSSRTGETRHMCKTSLLIRELPILTETVLQESKRWLSARGFEPETILYLFIAVSAALSKLQTDFSQKPSNRSFSNLERWCKKARRTTWWWLYEWLL